MSTSPFASFTNAVLRFEVASGSLAPDSRGNMRPGKAIVEIQAMLSQKSNANRSNDPGVDLNRIYVEGYITSIVGQDSLVLPSIVSPDSPCQAIWQGRNGQFFVEFLARNPYLAALSIDLVEKVKGYFQPSSFVVSGEPWVPTPAPTPDPGTSTDYQSAETDATVVAGQPLYVKSNGHVDLASASSIATAYVCGLAVSSASTSLSVSYSPDSVLDLPNWTTTIGSSSLTPGQRYFLSPVAGKLTTIAPTTEGQLVVLVGTALSTTKLSIEIQTPILL